MQPNYLEYPKHRQHAFSLQVMESFTIPYLFDGFAVKPDTHTSQAYMVRLRDEANRLIKEAGPLPAEKNDALLNARVILGKNLDAFAKHFTATHDLSEKYFYSPTHSKLHAFLDTFSEDEKCRTLFHTREDDFSIKDIQRNLMSQRLDLTKVDALAETLKAKAKEVFVPMNLTEIKALLKEINDEHKATVKNGQASKHIDNAIKALGYKGELAEMPLDDKRKLLRKIAS